MFSVCKYTQKSHSYIFLSKKIAWRQGTFCIFYFFFHESWEKIAKIVLPLQHGNPENPETPENPENPENPETPDNSDNPDNPENQ